MSNSSIEQQVVLPSKGVLYPNNLQEVTVKSMTTKEEKLIYSGGSAVNQKIDTLIKRCVDLPEDLTVYDLLDFDRMYLVLIIRQLSFGSEDRNPVSCECCNNTFNYNINLNDLKIKYYDGSEQEPFSFVLPHCQKTIGYKMLRGKDENAIYQYKRREDNKRGSNSMSNDSYEYSLARRITHIDGTKIDTLTALDFVKNLVTKDSSAFKQDIEKNTAGVEFELEIECPRCAYPIETYYRITSSFFRTERS